MLGRTLVCSACAWASLSHAQGLTAEVPLVEPPSFVASGQRVGAVAISADRTRSTFLVAWIDARWERRLMLTRAAPAQFLPSPREGVRLDTSAYGWPNSVSLCFDGVSANNKVGWVAYESAPPNRPPVVVVLQLDKDTLAAGGPTVLIPPVSPGNPQTAPTVRCVGDRAYVAFSEQASGTRVVRAALLQASQAAATPPIFVVDAGAADSGVTPAVALAPSLAFNRVGLAFTAPEGQSLLQLDLSLSQVLARSQVTRDRLTPAALTSDLVGFHAASSSLPSFERPTQARVFLDGGVLVSALDTSNATVKPGSTTHGLAFDGTAVHHAAVSPFEVLYWRVVYAPDFRVEEEVIRPASGESSGLAVLPGGSVAAAYADGSGASAVVIDPSRSALPSVVSAVASTQRWPVATGGGLLAWCEQLEAGYGVFAARVSSQGALQDGPVLVCQTPVEVKPQLAQRGSRTLLWWTAQGATRGVELPRAGPLSGGCGSVFPTDGELAPGPDDGVLSLSRSPLRLLSLSPEGALRDAGAALSTVSVDEAALAQSDGGVVLAWLYGKRVFGGRVDGALVPAQDFGEALTVGSAARGLALTQTPEGAVLLVAARLPTPEAPERLYAQWVRDGRPGRALEVPVAEGTVGTGVLHHDGRRVWAAWQEALDGGARWQARRMSDRAELLDSAPLELFRSRDAMPGLAMSGSGPVRFVVSRRDPERVSERLAERSYLGRGDGEACSSSWDCSSAVCAQGLCCGTPCAFACGQGRCEVPTDAGPGDGGAVDGGPEEALSRARSALGCQCGAGQGPALLLLGLLLRGGRWRRARCWR